jgi:hypothetical protein
MTEHLQKAVYIAVKNYIINDLGFSREDLKVMIEQYTKEVIEKILKEQETYIKDMIEKTVIQTVTRIESFAEPSVYRKGQLYNAVQEIAATNIASRLIETLDISIAPKTDISA